MAHDFGANMADRDKLQPSPPRRRGERQAKQRSAMFIPDARTSITTI